MFERIEKNEVSHLIAFLSSNANNVSAGVCVCVCVCVSFLFSFFFRMLISMQAGVTPMHVAARLGCADILNQLIAAGAYANVCDKVGCNKVDLVLFLPSFLPSCLSSSPCSA